MIPHILIPCGNAKLAHAAPARDLYTGSLFRLARRFAEARGPWWILSAKHGLVHPDTVLEPYNVTLQGPNREDYARVWATLVAGQVAANIPEGTPLVRSRPAAYTGWVSLVTNPVTLPLKGQRFPAQSKFYARGSL